MRKKKKSSNPSIVRLLTVRAYCSKCGKLLMESKALTKAELLANWDHIVLEAPGAFCQDCGTKVPNFDIVLKIYHSIYKREWLPEEILPQPKNAPDVEKLAETPLSEVLNS